MTGVQTCALPILEEIADWIFLMKQGQFIAQGTLMDLKEHYLEVAGDKEPEKFNLEKLYLFYFSEERV